MTQEALNFGRLYRVTDSVRDLYKNLNVAVELCGGIVPAAGACGIDRADLRRALDRDGRRVAVEHAMSLAAIAPAHVAKSICSAFVKPNHLELAPESPPMADHEKAARLEAALRMLGPLGEQAMHVALNR